MKTRAAVLRALNAPFSVETVELDPPRRGEVLVRMVASGVCQSDLHFITGHRKTFLPAVRGHEGGGAGEVIAVDINPAKEAVARDFGATRFIDGRADVLQEIRDASDGQGVDKVILTIDHVRAEHIALGIEATAPCGVTVLVGAADDALDHIPAYPTRMLRAQKTFTATLAGGPNPPRDALRYLRLYQAGRLRLDDFVTRTYSLDDINDAVDDLRAGKNIRGVIVMDESA